MPKVLTSAGMQNFVETGKVEEIKPSEKPAEKAPEKPSVAAGAEVAAATESAKDAAVEAVTAAKEANKGEKIEDLVKELGLDKEFSADELKTIGERVTRSMAQKHRRMKEAQEAAAEADRFAEQQFNERRLIEQERDKYKTEIEKLRETKLAETKKEPVIDDFKDDKGNLDWAKFVDARSEWRAEQAVAKDREAREKAEREQRAKVAEEAARARFQAASKRYPDFSETMKQAGDIMIQDSVLGFLAEDERGPDLTYFLIKNPDEVAKMVQMSQTRALAYAGELAGKLEIGKSGDITPSNGSREAEKNGGAPAPITPLGNGSGVVPKDPSKMNYRELRAYERQRQVEKRARH